MRRDILLVPLLLAACSYPQFVATKTVETEFDAALLEQLQCTTHNGGITITGSAERTNVRVRAELSVRGDTQEQADANLNLVSLGQRQEGKLLALFVDAPREQLRGMSPSGRFVIDVPARLAVTLDSHNGDVRATGVAGTFVAETHNGEIVAEVAATNVKVETHNGDVELVLTSGGALQGELTTHNGDVGITLPDGVDARFQAATHNGRIVAPNGLSDVVANRRSVSGRLGEGTGALTVTTHNGDVTARSAAGSGVR